MGTIQPFDPEMAPSYGQGAVIWYGGALWRVNVDSPTGIPGSSPDYSLLTQIPMFGPTGLQGSQGDPSDIITEPYVPGSIYKFGDIVYYKGQLYMVNKDNPQGAPGSSPDFSLITGLVSQGVTGPTGPQGGNFPLTWDPNESPTYREGMIIYYNGNIYQVNKDDPSGVPGSSCDYTLISSFALNGPTGPMGPDGEATVSIWDENTAYAKGNIVYYNGALWSANVDNPTGPPGTTSDFTLVEYMMGVGPTGPTGDSIPTTFDPETSSNYPVGQLVYYQGNIYEVNTANPQGVPGESSDYTLVQGPQAPVQGPPGETGPTGLPFDCGCTDLVQANTDQINSLQDSLNNLLNNINNIIQQIDDTQTRINDLLVQAQTNASDIASMQDQVEAQACVIQQLTGSLGKYACDNIAPFQINSATYVLNPWQGSNSQMIQQGQVVPTGGTFFGCNIYRACFYGTQTNMNHLLGGGSGNPSLTQLLPTCIVSSIVNAGGWFTDGNGSQVAVQKGNFYTSTSGWLTMDTPSNGELINGPYYVWVDFTCCPSNGFPTCPTMYCLDCCSSAGDCKNNFCAQQQTGSTCPTNSDTCPSGFKTPCNCACCTVNPGS